jgi:hypothetical protein
MTIDDLIQEFPVLEEYSDPKKLEMINEAYWYVANKLVLYPIVVSLKFNELVSINLLNTEFVSEDVEYVTERDDQRYELKSIMFKEITAVHSAEHWDTHPVHFRNSEDVIEKINYLIKLQEPTGKSYLDGEVVYAEGIINVLGYAYPYLCTSGNYNFTQYNEIKEKHFTPGLVYPLIAMMHAIHYRNRLEPNMESMYESLAIKYIKLYNDNVNKPKLSLFTSLKSGATYEL